MADQYLYFHGLDPNGRRGYAIQGASEGITASERDELERLSYFAPVRPGVPVALARWPLASGRVVVQRKIALPYADGRYLVHGLVADPAELTLGACAALGSSPFWIESDAGEHGRTLPSVPVADLVGPHLPVAPPIPEADVLDLLTTGQADFGHDLGDSLQAIAAVAPYLLPAVDAAARLVVGETPSSLGSGRQTAFSRLVVPEGEPALVELLRSHVASGGRLVEAITDDRATYELVAPVILAHRAATDDHTVIDLLVRLDPPIARLALTVPAVAETLVGDLRRRGPALDPVLAPLVAAAEAEPPMSDLRGADQAIDVYRATVVSGTASGDVLPTVACALLAGALGRSLSLAPASELAGEGWPARVIRAGAGRLPGPPRAGEADAMPGPALVALWRLGRLDDPVGEVAAVVASRPGVARSLADVLRDVDTATAVVASLGGGEAALEVLALHPPGPAVRIARGASLDPPTWRALLRRGDVDAPDLLEGCATLQEAVEPVIGDLPALRDIARTRWADQPATPPARRTWRKRGDDT